MNSLINKIFHFLSSVKLAILLLCTFTSLLIFATIYESNTSIEDSQRLIYQTRWFDFLLFLLGTNVFCAALSRYPWKRKHIGFVITHLGILIILFGSMLTRKFGVEGQMILQEGEKTDSILITNESTLAVSVPALQVREEFTPWFVNDPIPAGKEIEYPVGNTGMVCYVEKYYFNPRLSEQIFADGQQVNPAVSVTIYPPNAPNPFQDWLFSEIPGREGFNLGIAQVNFYGEVSREQLEMQLDARLDGDEPRKGEIVFQGQGEQPVGRVRVDDLLRQPVEFDYEGFTYQTKLTEYLPHAAVENNQLVNQENGKFNPAVRFELKGPKGTEPHLAFALFPELGSLHGGQDSRHGFEAR